MRTFKFISSTFLTLLVLAGCQDKNVPSDMTQKTVQEIPSPAKPGSEAPNLAVDKNGDLYLSWIEEIETTRVALKSSRFRRGAWSQSQNIAEGDDWFVNWADFPSMSILNSGTLAAHWLAKSSAGVYAYDVNIAFSQDGGATWGEPIVPHDDGTATEHGFASLLPWGDDQLFAVWLDGRNTGGGRPESAMTLRAAILDATGKKQHEVEIDPRVCDCCQTSAKLIPGGAIVAYRDRSATEVRDMSIRRFIDGEWEDAKTLYADNWEIAACPVNGPFISTRDEKVAIAWFTMAQNTPRVNLCISEDGGKTFGDAIRIDDGSPLGRVAALILPNDDILVSWLEKTQEDAEIRIRRIKKDGAGMNDSKTIAASTAARTSGFPRMALHGNEIIFAWTHVGDRNIVKTAKAALSEF